MRVIKFQWNTKTLPNFLFPSCMEELPELAVASTFVSVSPFFSTGRFRDLEFANKDFPRCSSHFAGASPKC